jgi:integrase
LTKHAVAALKVWLRNVPKNSELLFPTARGGRLSADAVQRRVAKYKLIASRSCPSLTKKRLTPHVLRHYADLRTMPTVVQASLPEEPLDGAFVDLVRVSGAA